MPNENITAEWDSSSYSDNVIIETLDDGSYLWKVDNKRFTFADYTNVTEADIPNPYYRTGLENAVSSGSVIIKDVNVEPDKPPTYRIWNLVPPDQVPHGNKSIVPYAVNYKGIDLIKRLHPRNWMVHGLVVQIVYYEQYDVATETFSKPVIRERWTWTLDPDTNFVQSRNIKIEWFANEDDMTDPDNSVSVILPPHKEYLKYYTDPTSKIKELIRRRTNVTSNLEQDIIGMIMYTEGMVVTDAIYVGQLLLTQYNSLKLDFVNHGTDDLANMLMSPDAHNDHPWLGNDLAILGLPGVTIAQYVYSELTTDISDKLDTFNFDDIPEY